jgi:polysaccharide biosynthesis protein PslH
LTSSRASRPVRSLVVAHTAPWPADSGGKIRLDMAVRGLARAGDVDVFAFDWEGTSTPIDLVHRYGHAKRARPNVKGALGRARWLVAGRQPLELTNLRVEDTRPAFERFVAGQSYDFVWFSLPPTYAVLGELVDAPAVLDCHDLEHYKHAARERHVRPTLDDLRAAGARFSNTVNIRRWRRYYERVHREVARICVCSTIDAERLALPGLAVIPNGFPRPERPAGDAARGAAPPTLVFPGTMTYGPNVDAASYLAQEIVPVLLAKDPAVRVRLVGRADERVQALHRPPEIEVTGQVPDMATELARADVVVVPIRFGSGTRLKVLEAFAHRLPVVSTRLGAEGLGVVHDEHALLADDPEEFAEACLRVIGDPDLARRLVDAGEQLFLSRYGSEALEERIAALAREVAR